MPSTDALIEFLTNEVKAKLAQYVRLKDKARQEKTEKCLEMISESHRSRVERYQLLCATLAADENPNALEFLIRRAVLRSTDNYEAVKNLGLDNGNFLDDSVDSGGFLTKNGAVQWHVRDALLRLARFVDRYPGRRGDHTIITTNFDPLISVAFNKQGIDHTRLTVDLNVPLGICHSSGPVVYHIHGYWATGKLLNTEAEIDDEARDAVSSSLTRLLRDRTVIVLGYGGGWKDVIMDAIRHAAHDGSTDIVWCCHSQDESFEREVDELLEKKLKLKANDRITFVSGVDAETFLSDALERIEKIPSPLEEKQRELDNKMRELQQKEKELAEQRELLLQYKSELEKILEAVNESRALVQMAVNAVPSAKAFQDHRQQQIDRFNHIDSDLAQLRASVSEVKDGSNWIMQFLKGMSWSFWSGLRLLPRDKNAKTSKPNGSHKSH